VTVSRPVARAFVIAGYAILAMAALVNFLQFAVDGDLRLGVREDLSVFAVVFASFSGIVAWWILTKLAERPEQAPLLQKAYLALAVQALLGAAPYVIADFSFDLSSWSGVAFWAYGIGSVLTAVGFILMAASFRPHESATLDVSVVPAN